ASPPPAPAAAVAVVISVESAVLLGHLHGHDGDISVRFDLRPALRRERGVDSGFDPVDPKRVFRVDVLPGVGSISAEIRVPIVVRLHLLSKRRGGAKKRNWQT